MDIEKKKDGRANNGGPRPKTRPDDRRGGTPGIPGQPAYTPSHDEREKVRDYARVCNEDQIAILLGISVSTLQRHFKAELEQARAQTSALIGSKLIAQALSGDKTAMIFYLKTRGGWAQKHEIAGKDGGPIRTFDLSGYAPDDLKTLMPILDQLIAEASSDDDGA